MVRALFGTPPKVDSLVDSAGLLPNSFRREVILCLIHEVILSELEKVVSPNFVK